jgi:HK97 family phage portal protein
MAGAIATARKALSIYTQGQGNRFLGWDGTIIGARHGLPGERRYERFVGDGKNTGLLVSALNWIAREFPLAPPALMEVVEGEVPQIVRQHDLLTMLRFPTADPNDRRMRRGFYHGRVLWATTAMDFTADGNSYWWKRRDQLNNVRQLWWLPTSCMLPKGAPEGGQQTKYIDHYEYNVQGKITNYDPWDIVHFRFGLDYEDPRKGLSPVRALLREFFTDEVAARFVAALLHNAGYPGIVIIPDANTTVDDEGALEVKKRFTDEFSADRTGEPIVLRGKAEVKTIAWSPKDLDLSQLRDVPEERVSAAIGIPAAVLGFGTGLQQVKVGATMRELRAQGWEGAVIPTHGFLAGDIEAQLLPEFLTDATLNNYEFGFDLSRVPVMLENQKKRADIEIGLVQAGIKMRSEARGALGLRSTPEDNVYIPQRTSQNAPQPGDAAVDPNADPTAGDDPTLAG